MYFLDRCVIVECDQKPVDSVRSATDTAMNYLLLLLLLLVHRDFSACMYVCVCVCGLKLVGGVTLSEK